MSNYFENKGLLEIPAKRSAYSDRTSYLMAEMSRLAYFKFEGGNNLDEIITQVRSLLPNNDKLVTLEALIKSQIVNSSANEAKAVLADILDQHGYSLIETFCDSGTDAQAFLCRCNTQNIMVLAFRGTELNLKDIKADIKTGLIEVETNDGPVLLHSGYYAQYESLKDEIKKSISSDSVKDLQLFITGHSLGGALAITAVRFMENESTGACYTFGSPPVGTNSFDHHIRTPIYRIVNHVDIVPRLPNPVLVQVFRWVAFGLGILLSPFAGLVSQVKDSNWYRRLSKNFIDMQKYRQSGYGSYLVGEGKAVHLKYNVSFYDRFFWWTKQFINIFKGDFKLLSDHSIEKYSAKLATCAKERQK